MKEIKLNNHIKLIIFFFIIINLIQVIISESGLFIKNLDLNYTHALSLINGNIFIIHKNGVVVYNYNFTIILYNYDFGGIPLISSEEDNNFTSLIQCNDDINQYVLALINDKTYIFSSRGLYLFHTSNTLFTDFSTEVFYHYYSFLYYKYEDSVYYFIVSFINNQNFIKVIEFQINMNTQSFNIYKEKIYNQSNIVSDSVPCQIINSNNYINVLSCFYAKKNDEINYKNNFMLSLFKIENDFEIINETIALNGFDYSNTNYLIKSSIGKDQNKIFIDYIYPVISTLFIIIFDFDLYQSNQFINVMECKTGTDLINIYYFNYINQFIFSCNSNNGVSLIRVTNDSIVNFLYDINNIDYSNCTHFINLDVIFLLYKGEYNMVANFLCGISTTQVFKFPNNILINNYNLPSDEPESSYLFSNFTITPTTVIKEIKTTTPITTFKEIKTAIPITTFKGNKTTTPITTIKEVKTTIPTTIIKEIKTSIPITTIRKIKTTIPITTIKQIRTTSPITTIKKIKTTTPTTANREIKTTIPITTINEIKTTTPTTFKKIKTSIPTTIKKTKTTIPISTFKGIKTNIPSTIIVKTSTVMIYSTIHNKYLSTTTPLFTTIFHTSSTSIQIISEDNCKLKCLTCNKESSSLDLCIQCNTNKKYYPSKIVGEEIYVECYNNETKPSNYFFNKNTKYYEPCYSKCKSCEYPGNEDVNNCTVCKNNYIFRPDQIDSSNCVLKCKYYYYISFGVYYCTLNKQCPIKASLLIRNKDQCIDNCNNDNEYIYQFNYECLKECPEDTLPDEDNICKLIDKNKCYLYSDYLLNINYKDLESNNFDNLINRYIVGFEDTDYHVDFYESDNYTITIYKTMYCLKELKMSSTIIDFGECYEKIQNYYNLEGKSLIILISDFFKDKKLIDTLFYFYHPETGEELPIDEVCSEEKLIVEKSLNYYPEINIEQAKFFEEQNINIFNSSDVFYNDLCIFFESPNKKDVPLKERILIFFPNVTLCEENCKESGVNLTSMKAICECKLKELLNEAKDATKLVGLDFSGVIESLSIDVVKCYKTLFQYKYFTNCYGGFFSILLILIQTVCVIIIGKISMIKIKKTTFSLIENYCNLLNSPKALKYPPKKKIRKKSDSFNFKYNSNTQNDSKLKNSKLSLKNTSKSLLFGNNRKIININKNTKKLTSEKSKSINSSMLPLNDEISIKAYLSTSLNDLDYDELIVRENRSYWRMLLDKLVSNQKIIDLFYNNNWVIPRPIRLIFLIVMVDLYFLVNALFYNEEYITDLYYSDEEETFFSFVPRSLNRIIYTSFASSVLDFIISLLFPSENKIKKILIRKKNDIKEMKHKVLISMKNIINNYWIFIIISYILTVFSWYYISCFNNVYPYLKIEWIKSSIFIFTIVQLFIIIECLLFAFLRFISLKCKNEKIYRISNYF